MEYHFSGQKLMHLRGGGGVHNAPLSAYFCFCTVCLIELIGFLASLSCSNSNVKFAKGYAKYAKFMCVGNVCVG